VNEYSSSRRIMVQLRPGQSAILIGGEYAAKFDRCNLKVGKPGIGQQFALWFENSDAGDAEADDALLALKDDRRIHKLEDTIRWYANHD